MNNITIKKPTLMVIGGMVGVVALLKYIDYKKNNNQDQDETLSTTKPTTKRKSKLPKGESYFRLSSDIKIHLIDKIEQCDQLIQQLHKQIIDSIESLNNSNNINDNDEPTLRMITPDQCVINNHKNNNNKNSNHFDSVLGLDAEWGGSDSTGTKVALIQVSTKDDIYLIQCSQMDRFPKSLEDLLADGRILKTGVAIAQDATYILQNFNIQVKGCVDLVPLARLANFEGGGLAALATSVLGETIDKNYHVRCSQWDKAQLSDEQIHYAACDAWIGREIFIKMFEKYQELHPTSTPNDFAAPYVNSTFKLKPKYASSTSQINQNQNQKKEKAPTLNIPDGRVLYDNCLMYGPDGELLCNISKKKVAWYINRGLATMVKDNPLSIQLTFKPNGNGHAQDPYYLSDKENQCCACGSIKQILRHSIVPHSYRQYFPVEIKSHSSHDVVLLCCQCHLIMNKRLHFMKITVAQLYGVPYETGTNQLDLDKDILKYQKYAMVIYKALFENDPKKKLKIPNDKLEDFKQELMEHLGKAELLEEDLKELMEANPRHKNKDYVPHEQRIMDIVLSQGDEGLEKFIVLFRKNFIETCKPQFMNPHWDMYKPISRD